MIKIYACYFLLSALSIVEMKPLNKTGHVGKNVTFSCSDWNTWTDVKSNVKYFCNSPCTEDKYIIIKAAFQKTERKNRIELTNSGDGLFVTFTNLKKSDSGKYYCGVERYGYDRFIEVNLQVTDAESPGPKTTPKTVSVMTSFTVSSTSSNIITDKSTSFNIHPTTTATTPGVGSAPYVSAGLISIITLLVVMLTRRMMKKRPRVVSITQEDPGENPAGPDGVYQSLHPFTKDEDQVYCTLNPTKMSAGPDEVYQSLLPSTKDEDQVYCTLNPKERNSVLEKLPMGASSGS